MRTTSITFAASPLPNPQTPPRKKHLPTNKPTEPEKLSKGFIIGLYLFSFLGVGFMSNLYFKVNASFLEQALAKLESADEKNELYRKSLIRYPGDGNIVAVVLNGVPAIEDEPVRLKILARILGLEDWNDDPERLATAFKSIQLDSLRESAETFLANHLLDELSPNQARKARLALIDQLNTEAYQPIR